MQILQRVDQMRTTMTRFVTGEPRRFVIGLDPSTLYARLSEVIRRFREISPDVDLSLAGMTTLDQISALTGGRINVGLGRVRLNAPGIRQEVLRKERLVAAVPPGHPLAVSDDPLELPALATFPVITCPREPRPSYAEQVLSLSVTTRWNHRPFWRCKSFKQPWSWWRPEHRHPCSGLANRT
jgi:LysR family transcriptional regulator, benzoate and cis,cis-muconate-responsive activator of ben and cat genes